MNPEVQQQTEICPLCEGRSMGPGEACLAGCADGMVLPTTAHILRNIKPWMLADRKEIEQLKTENERLKGALDILQMREAAYRSTHDLNGDGSMKTGAAWDAMRRAGDKARALLSSREE